MGWKELDDRLKKAGDANYVSCEDNHELRYIRRSIKQEFPDLEPLSIVEAVYFCCQVIPAPRPRAEFIDCLRRRLSPEQNIKDE